MNISKVKRGDYYSRLSFGKVTAVGTTDFQVTNEKGESWSIGKKVFEMEFKTHNQFDESIKVSKTELINTFLSNPRTILTVDFNKQVKEKDVVDQLVDLYPNKGKIVSEADYKKKVKEIVGNVIVGEERIMVGRHNGSVDEFGRVHFVDMEVEKDESKEYDTRMRLVDPRTINWLIVDNKKYELK